MKTNHNQYVSTPNWFSSIKEEVKQTKPVIQQTVYYGSGSNSNNNGISSLSIYNKAVYKEDTLQLSDLSITGYAVIAIQKKEEDNAGELTVNDVWSSSLFIPVVGGSEITINTSYDSTFTYGIAFYDIQKKYISGNHTVQELIQTVIVPVNAVYFRICSLSVYEEFNVKYQGLSNYSYKQLTDIYDKGLDPFTSIDNSFEYIYSSTFKSDKISFVADHPLKLEIDSDNNIHFNINDLLLSGVFVTTSEEEQDIAGIKIFKNGLGIGDFLLIPDKTNNSIKLIHKNELIGKESNTYFGNMYVTGWLSALGMSPGGTGPSFGGSNNLFELNDVSTVYNEQGIPYAVLGTTGENTVGKVLTWDGSKWYADESLNSIKGDERYLLKKIFSKIFTAYDEKGEIIDITDYNSIIDNISINYSLWSTGFISAYGMSKGYSNPTALYQLTDVLSDNNEVQGAVIGSVLTYNGTHWYASKLDIDSSIDINDVLNILEQYNYLTKGDAEELFLTKNQADDKYLLKQVFKNIFTAYDANDNEVDICDISANINNIKINYGFWSNGFISALGKQLTEPSSATALYQLVDVLANETNTGVKHAKKGSVLTFDGVHWVAGVVNANGGIIDEAAIMEIIERYNYIDSKYLSDNRYLTIDSADERYLLNDLFLKIFTAYDEQGNQVDLSSDKINNIKVNYNFWSDGYLSSRGISDDIIDAIDFIEVDEKTISKRNGYLEVIGGVGNSGGVTDYNDLTNKPDLSIYALKSQLDGYATKSSTLAGYGITNAYTKTQVDNLMDNKADWGATLLEYGIADAYTKTEVGELLDDYLPLAGGTITGDLRLRKGSEYTSPYLYFGDSDEVWMKEATNKHLTIHADGSVKIDSPKTIIDGIEIKKSESGVLFIDANLVVSGGITMYGTDGTTANTIWDDAPKATTTNNENGKGIASFDSKYFSVTNGHVTFIGSTGGGGGKNLNITLPDGTTNVVYNGNAEKSIVLTRLYKSEEVTTATTDEGTITPLAMSTWTTNKFPLKNGTGATGEWGISIKGNAATATTLKTSRTIWGQSFNGSGNVSGNLKLESSSLLMESDNSHGDSIWSIFAYGPTLQFKHGSAGGSASNMGLQISRTNNQVTTYGSILPSTNLSYNLGSASAKWYNICGAYVYGYDALYVGSDDYFLSTFTNGLQIGTYSLFKINQNGTTRLYMNASGNFGIGTTSPQSKLHVVGAVQADTAFQLPTVDNAFTGGNLLWKLSSTTYGRLGTNTSGDMGIYARNSVVIRGGATSSNAPTTGMEIDKDGVSFIKSNTAYGVIVKRLNSSGGAFTKYLPCNQESKSWAVGVNNSYQYSWWYQNGTSDVQKMKLDDTGSLSSDYWKISNLSTNPYLMLTQGSTWYIQGYQGYLYLGAGSAKSMRIDSSGNVLSVGGITMYGSSDERLKQNIRTFNASKELMNLGGVFKFEYTDEEVERNGIYKGTHIGLIYQNVKNTSLAKMCYEREDGYGALNYLDSSFISLLAGVGVEHETRIQRLERENVELKKELEYVRRTMETN